MYIPEIADIPARLLMLHNVGASNLFYMLFYSCLEGGAESTPPMEDVFRGTNILSSKHVPE